MLRALPATMKWIDTSSLFERAVGTVLTWQARSEQRRRLAELDERLLRDIGLSALDVRREVSKPFWQD